MVLSYVWYDNKLLNKTICMWSCDGSETGEIVFENVEVPDEKLVSRKQSFLSVTPFPYYNMWQPFSYWNKSSSFRDENWSCHKINS